MNEHALVLVQQVIGGTFSCPTTLVVETDAVSYQIYFKGFQQYSICKTNKLNGLISPVGASLTYQDVLQTMQAALNI